MNLKIGIMALNVLEVFVFVQNKVSHKSQACYLIYLSLYTELFTTIKMVCFISALGYSTTSAFVQAQNHAD